MRNLIQNQETGLYLCKGNHWSRNPQQALAFLNEIRAHDHCVYHRLAQASVVVLPESQLAQWAGEPGADPFPTANNPTEIESMKPKKVQNSKSAKTETVTIGTEKVSSKPVKSHSASQPPTVKSAPTEAVNAAPTTAVKEAPTVKACASAPSRAEETVTTIEARIDVGLGNRLFIRGEGNGLSWEKGEPLQCVDGSTWVWSTTCSLDKLVFKLVLNDQVWAQGDNVTAPAGKRTEVAPAF